MAFIGVVLLLCFSGVLGDTATDFAQTPTAAMQAKMVSSYKACAISGTGCGTRSYYSTGSTAATAYWLENPPTQQVYVYIGDQWVTTNGAEITMTQALVEPLAISFPCSVSVSGSSSSEPYLYTVVLADVDGAPQSTAGQAESSHLWAATNYYCNANGGFCESNVKIGTACTTSCSVTTWITAATSCTTATAGSNLCLSLASTTAMKSYTMTVDKILGQSSVVSLETAFVAKSSTNYKVDSGSRTFTIDSVVANTTASPPFSTVNFKVATSVTSVSTDFAAAAVLTFDPNSTPVTVKSGTISSKTVTWTFNEDISVCTAGTDTTNCGTDMKTAIATLGGTFSTVEPTTKYLLPVSGNNYQIVADYADGTNGANGAVPTSAEITAAAGKQITPAKLFPNVVSAAAETGTSSITTESHRLMLLVYKQKSNTAISSPVTSPVGTNSAVKYKGFTPDAWAAAQVTAGEIESATPIAGVWFYATKTF